MGTPARNSGSAGRTWGKTLIWVPQTSWTRDFSTEDRPMVTMITLMVDSPMSGRSARRSTARPRSTEKPSVMRKAQRKGTWNCTVREKQT